MKTPRKPKTHGTVMHKHLGHRFNIVGARACEIGSCFVVTREDDITKRERIFHTDMFDREDFPTVVRNALYLELIEKEAKRVTNKRTKEAARDRARDARARAESDAEDEKLELQYRDISANSLAEYEPIDPLEPIENSEIISEEDSEGHESLQEEAEEELVEDE
jgi:hypothetical protein